MSRAVIVKLDDYRDRQAELKQRDNTFATVVLAHLQNQLTPDEPDSRLRSKIHPLRLYERGYQKRLLVLPTTSE